MKWKQTLRCVLLSITFFIERVTNRCILRKKVRVWEVNKKNSVVPRKCWIVVWTVSEIKYFFLMKVGFFGDKTIILCMSAQGRGRILIMCLPLSQRKLSVTLWGVWGQRCGHNYNCKWHRKLSQVHRNPWEQLVIRNCYPFFITRTIYSKTTMHQSTALKTLIITKHEIG